MSGQTFCKYPGLFIFTLKVSHVEHSQLKDTLAMGETSRALAQNRDVQYKLNFEF